MKKAGISKAVREKILFDFHLVMRYALETGMNPQTVRRWLIEDYWRLATGSSVHVLTKILGVSEEELFDFEEEESSFKN